MASKGPKTGTGTPAAPKPAAVSKASVPVKAPAKAPVAPKAKFVASKVEKPAPTPVAETKPVPVPFVEPVPAVAAAPQEVVKTVEAVTAPVVQAVTETATIPATVAKPVAEAVKESVKMETIENNTAKAQAFFTDFNDRTKAAMEKSGKFVEEANEFAKGNVEALVESGKIAAKGLESFGQDAAEYSRKSFESATAAMKTLASVKSPAEFFKLQSDFFRSAFDSYVAEASKNTEAMLKLAGDAAAPLSNRLAVAADKVKTAA